MSCAWPFYRPFLKHCTLSNKALGTIWRALSKHSPRRQGPNLRPLWWLVGTPSAIRTAKQSLPYSDVTIYIFVIYNMYYLCCTCIDFLWTFRLVGCWVDVVTPTDRLTSVRNRCVIDLFCGVVGVVSLSLLKFAACVGTFVIGLSQISSFFF